MRRENSPSLRAVIQIHHSERPHLTSAVNQWSEVLENGGERVPLCVYLLGDWKVQPHLSIARACFHNLSVPPSLDRYLTRMTPTATWNPWGLKSGPNWQFFQVLGDVSRNHPNEWTLLLETDTYPTRPDIVAGLYDLISSHPDRWVVGSIEPTVVSDRLEKRLVGHINGSALYHSGQPGFQAFLRSVWIPSLLSIVAERPDYPFDVLTAPQLWSEIPRELGDAWRREADRFIKVGEMLNLSNLTETEAADLLIGLRRGGEYPSLVDTALIVHSKWNPRSSHLKAGRSLRKTPPWSASGRNSRTGLSNSTTLLPHLLDDQQHDSHNKDDGEGHIQDSR